MMKTGLAITSFMLILAAAPPLRADSRSWTFSENNKVRLTQPYLELGPEAIAPFDRRVIYFGDVFTRE
jgi:hypothetical protein